MEKEEDMNNHKTVFINQRWHRETDMRQLVRHLAEYGEKMVQKDRSRDYEEDFEESFSEISDMYSEDSD